ncbi:MAG TPA: zf-HC2 domain-containing protein, partial [Actinotalea sp.]|nr:zf-HC2 domain-containing protein [Actinotalea sp.]
MPITVPGNHTVTGVQLGDGELEVDLAGPEGLVVVRQTRGRLAEVGTAVSLGDRQVRQVGDNPTYLAWQSGDAVITAMAEGPRWALAPVVAAYPVESYDDRASARLGRGWQILMTVWSGS